MALLSDRALGSLGLSLHSHSNVASDKMAILGSGNHVSLSLLNGSRSKIFVPRVSKSVDFCSKEPHSNALNPSSLLGYDARKYPRQVLAKSSAAGVGSLSNEFGGGDGNSGDGKKGTGGNGGGGNGDSGSGEDGFEKKNEVNNPDWILGALAKGWNDRVSADPQFVFKVLTEQVIGVTACVIGDMASRPNFGINELDFVFSTLVVGSLVNFLLMYMLAPVSASSSVAATLPGIFSKSPFGHMFEAGSYTTGQRLGTFVYKGLQFASAGFAAGLLGTAISNALLFLRKKLQPDFKLQNPSPPTILNASTWALHLGVSSNLRYQCLNGLEGVLSQKLSPSAFKTLVFIIRGINNVIGGSTFAILAKATGAQKAAAVQQ